MNFKSYLVLILLIFINLIWGCGNKNEKHQVVAPTENKVTNPDPGLGSSIHEAALNGDFSRISMLLEKGNDVNILDEQGRTALMYAAFNGHSSIIKKLLEKNASVNLQDKEGRTALMMASSGPYPEAIKLLLDNRAEINITDKAEHFTALMYAAAEGQLDNVKVLLSYNADPSLKDIDGDNAMTFAIKNGHTDIAALLNSIKK